MALSNRQRVQGAQDALLDELVVFIERSLRKAFGDAWVDRVTSSPRLNGTPIDALGKPQWDMQLAVKVIAEFWNEAFGEKLKQTDRNNIFELRDWRNALAHDQPFTYDDTYRALDTMQRVASRCGLQVAAHLVKERDEVMRVKLREQERSVSRSVTHVEGKIPEGLKAWREVIIPHADVREGKFQAAEFAADLAQVYKGEASPEYGKPREFFGRTFVTAGLRDLLTNALTRLGKGEGDPVVELQTNFGGGKTHSMLALYHLFGEVPSRELPGLEEVHLRAGVPTAPAHVNRAVLVGNSLGTGQRKQQDGTVTNTIWGEMAYQLAGAQGYALVAQADEQRTNPGTENLIRLFKLASPCLILIDEWVAQLRELYGRSDLPAGSFESNVSFAQSLTEAAKAVPTALVVASLPQSTSEVAGEGGSAALDALKQTFKRLQSTWLPANPEESFEIVRRRLFEPLEGDAHRQVDAVVKAFTDYYSTNKNDFPAGVNEGEYSRKLKNSYPIHPSLFDSLFGAWSTLDRFQRTRGVLRFMALVIHRLWQDGEKSLMILPGTLPLDDVRVQAELRNYLGESWEAIMNQEVDGPNSLPVQVEAEDKSGRLGQVGAARRVTRSVFMSTAPKASTAHQGVDTRQVFLSSVQPGETAGPFNDALRRVSQQAVYLYADASHYWFSTQPSLNRRAADLAAHLPEDVVHVEIERRLKLTAKQRGEFAGVHITADSSDVADESKEPGVRLVILPPEFPHTKAAHDSLAIAKAREMVTKKGGGDRLGRNNVVILAADKARLDDLNDRIRQYLAWAKIHEEADSSNLTPSDKRQAASRMKEHDQGSDAQIGTTYTFLLAPYLQDSAAGGPPSIAFDEERLAGEGELIEKVTKKLVNSGKFTRQFGGMLLDMQLRKLWAGKPHLKVQQLLEYFAQYLYLERVTSPEVLLGAIRDGLSANPPYFGYADGFRDDKYQNLKLGESANVRVDAETVLVSLEAAKAQREAEAATLQASAAATMTHGQATTNLPVGPDMGQSSGTAPLPKAVEKPLPKHVFAEGRLDDARMVKKFQTIYEEIIQQIIDAGGNVSVEVVIKGDVESGLDATKQRNLTENARNLGLKLNLD